MNEIKSLKNLSPEYIKKTISELLKVEEKDIRLFGSRINGGYREDSDLDVAIIGEYNKEREGKGFLINDLEIELHWVEDFNSSWLINSI